MKPANYSINTCSLALQAPHIPATEQWFASLDGFRQEALQAIDRVEWILLGKRQDIQHGSDRGDWCTPVNAPGEYLFPFFTASPGENLL